MKNLLDKAKKADKAQSQTERFDNFKKQQLVKAAEGEVSLRPNSKTAKQQLDQAMNVEYAYKRYREVLQLARKKGDVAAEQRLKALKTALDDDVAALRDVPPSLDALLDACDELRKALR